jgi:ribosomal protein L33
VPHKTKPVTCMDCQKVFEGTYKHKRCAGCAVEIQRQRALKASNNRVRVRIEKVCPDCNGHFIGPVVAKYCPECKRVRSKRFDAAYHKERYEAVKTIAKMNKFGIVVPPACEQCAYYEPSAENETGMLCRAEAMLRCKPYAPGAVPLLRREA